MVSFHKINGEQQRYFCGKGHVPIPVKLFRSDKFFSVNSVMNRASFIFETFCKKIFNDPHLLIIKGECWKY